MYNYNTIQGKLDRIEDLKRLVSLIGDIPGDYLSYLDSRAINQYLIDIKSDLEKQVAPTIAKRNNLKRYRYYFIDNDETIYADNGEEVERLYPDSINYKGNIKITDTVTGETNMMYHIETV